MNKPLVLLAAWLLLLPLPAAAQDRFVAKLQLPTGQTVVVAEGDDEARSIGSFSVRLYQATPAPDETTFFTTGLIHARDGTLEKVLLADVNGDRQPDIVVVARSAGTGGWLSAYAFSATDDRLALVATVHGLHAHADPLAALQARYRLAPGTSIGTGPSRSACDGHAATACR